VNSAAAVDVCARLEELNRLNRRRRRRRRCCLGCDQSPPPKEGECFCPVAAHA